MQLKPRYRNTRQWLSPTERKVLILLGSGLQLKQIEGRLGIQENTARIHRSEVYRKLGVDNVPQPKLVRALLIALFFRVIRLEELSLSQVRLDPP